MKVGGTVWNTLKGGGTEKRGSETKILKKGEEETRSRGERLKWRVWNPLMNYDLVLTVFRVQSSESKKPYIQWKDFTQQNLRKNHTNQDSKKREVVKGIFERDLQIF